MSEETEPILDDKKLLEKITNMEQLSQKFYQFKESKRIILKSFKKTKILF